MYQIISWLFYLQVSFLRKKTASADALMLLSPENPFKAGFICPSQAEGLAALFCFLGINWVNILCSQKSGKLFFFIQPR